MAHTEIEGGGAVTNALGGTLSIVSSHFDSNEAQYFGGAIFVDEHSLETFVYACSFVSNHVRSDDANDQVRKDPSAYF